MKQQEPNVFTKNADYVKSNLDTFLEATLKSKPKSLIHMGRNISKVRDTYVYLFTVHTYTYVRTYISDVQ